MVSDFIDKHNRYIRLTQDEIEKANTDGIELTQTEARRKIDYGINHDGYWNSPKLMAKIDNVVEIAAIEYPKETHTVVFVFDQSNGHTVHDETPSNAKRFNLNPGGKFYSIMEVKNKHLHVHSKNMYNK